MSPATLMITGASSGIGAALAREYARRGWNVGVLARREEALRELVSDLKAFYPNCRFVYATADVREEKAQFEALDRLFRELGIPQMFIANSGIGKGMDPRQPMWENTRDTLVTNVLGAIAGLEYVKERWIKEGCGGHLVGISSVASCRGLPGTAAYSASKAALSTYLESVRGTLRKAGITVTCVYPGFVRTPLTASNPWMPWLLEVDEAARRIADALNRRQPRFIFPFPMRLVFSVLRLMPDRLYDLLARNARSYKKLD